MNILTQEAKKKQAVVKFAVKNGKSEASRRYAVSFADTEKNNIGTRASKALQNGTPVCILTGSITDKEGNNGTVYHNTRGFEFVCGFTQRADT